MTLVVDELFHPRMSDQFTTETDIGLLTSPDKTRLPLENGSRNFSVISLSRGISTDVRSPLYLKVDF
jgi:hypothetical protein